MRWSTSSLVFVFCVAAGAALSACSGETTENPGGGDGGSGGSGAAGATSSTTSATTSAATTTSAAATTSSGSGGEGGSDGVDSVCDQACSRADECNVPVCNLLTFDCADPAAECAAQCVLDADCAQIQSLAGTEVDPELAGCMSACGGEQGGNGLVCLQCSGQAGCLSNCAFDPTCQPWFLCARECIENDPQPQCFRACDAANPGAAEMVDDVYACTCSDCAESCDAVVDACSP